MSSSQLAFPLVDSSYDTEEIIRCMETILSGQLTMGARVREFEQAFAAKLGAPFAVMVNSGSSANLLAVSALVNPARKRRLAPGDRVAVPAVCWSTSLWPLVQMGLCPVLIDVDPSTLNLSIPSLLQAMESQPIRAVMMVHILGCSTDLEALLQIVWVRHCPLLGILAADGRRRRACMKNPHFETRRRESARSMSRT